MEKEPEKADPNRGHQQRNGEVAFSLHCAVEVPTEQHHAYRPEDKGQSGQQSGLGIAYAKVFDDCWQEKGNSVTRRIQTEIHKSAKQNAGIRECLKQRKMFDVFLVSLF